MSAAVARASRSKRFRRSGAVRDFCGEDLDRHLAVELGVAGAPHLTHPTGPDGAEDFIPAETITLRKGHFVVVRVAFSL